MGLLHLLSDVESLPQSESERLMNSHIATVKGRVYHFYPNTHRGKDYITIEHLNEAGQVQRKDYVSQPHPAYQDGQWQREYFEKLLKSANVTRLKARRQAK